MAAYPALPLFTDSYMADTRHLTTLQHGAYLLMLMTAWRMPDCSLPDDDQFLSRICGLDKRTWKSNKDVLMSFWKLDDQQRWYQGRLKDERIFVVQKRNKNAEAGKASALKRKNRDLTSVQPKSNQNPTPTPTPTPIKPKGLIYTSEFDSFWNVYPRRDGSKAKASEIFNKLIKEGISHETIINGASRYAEACGRAQRESRYIKHATTWLNGREWEADYSCTSEPAAKRKGKGDLAREYIAEGLREYNESNPF